MPVKRWLLTLSLLALAACAVPLETPTPSPAVPTEPSPSATPPPSATPGPVPPSATPPLEAATAGPAQTSVYETQPGDKGLQRGNLFIEDIGVKVVPGAPAQVLLSLSGNRPSPCHHVRVEVGPPDASLTLPVQAYTVLDADQVCLQVLRPFAAEIPLDPLPPGRYTLIINDELKAAFTV